MTATATPKALSTACVEIVVGPCCVNITFYEGDDVFFDITVSDPTTDPPTPVDITGALAEAQIRSSVDSETVLARFDCTVEGNVVHLHLPATENQNMPLTAVWDCQIIWNGNITTLVYGAVHIQQEVTRPEFTLP